MSCGMACALPQTNLCFAASLQFRQEKRSKASFFRCSICNNAVNICCLTHRENGWWSSDAHNTCGLDQCDLLAFIKAGGSNEMRCINADQRTTMPRDVLWPKPCRVLRHNHRYRQKTESDFLRSP